ncbi:DUF3019 domain-containing protein [Colwellia sp. M166]|uniref:DUF3019 domain-containing protein n=1 Tax=Colwellia sp. M166 TaxID=2583805 RepID=UPI00211DFA78|nr:DUF3019 domain-containing protein [Colwellia sp. M166]UUO24419.1 DUF3019 domain-containing protein [Colwellia sp. M166]|tara:strand:+ start:9701 stop:10111 length:411 start_codon:yes stop_codon:yes gene_type:complete
MSSKWDIGIVLLIYFSCTTVNAATIENSATIKVSGLSAMPTKCITLTQGRQCFATVTLRWQAPVKGNYCIYQVGKNKALDCWYNQQQNTTTFEFESSKTVQYKLVAYDQEQTIAYTHIEVSWVHKASPRKRRWRLF